MNRPSDEPGQQSSQDCRATGHDLSILLNIINRAGLKQLKAKRTESPKERGRLTMEAEAMAEFVRSCIVDGGIDLS